MVRFDHPWVDRANTRSDVARRNLQSHAQIDWINLGLGPRIEGGFALGGQQCGAERATFESFSSANILPTSTTILIFSMCIEASLLVDRIDSQTARRETPKTPSGPSKGPRFLPFRRPFSAISAPISASKDFLSQHFSISTRFSVQAFR